jgi:hypothetical protein
MTAPVGGLVSGRSGRRVEHAGCGPFVVDPVLLAVERVPLPLVLAVR